MLEFFESVFGQYLITIIVDVFTVFVLWKRTGKVQSKILTNDSLVNKDIIQEDLEKLIAYHEKTAQELKNKKGD